MKILKNEKVLKICLILMLMVALILGCMGNEYASETQGETKKVEKKISVMYNTHMQNKGWEKDFSKKDGQTSGSYGQSLRLEAIKIKLKNAEGISIKYQTHIQNVGWQGWKSDGGLSGTSGKSLRLEGIKIKLEDTEKYSVMYRVHVQNIGWQEWKYDGEMAGTSGKSLRLEAIEIKIVDKVEKGKMHIDTAISDTYYGDKSLNISGWKMANVSNTKIKVTIDNKEDVIKDENIIYIARQDAINAIEGYGTIKQNPKPGFNFQINLNNLTSGEHTLEIMLISKDDKILSAYTKKLK